MDTRDQIIKIVYTFERMRYEQIALMLGMNTPKYVRDHYLTPMSAQGYLHRFLESNTNPGIKPYLYRLGPKGIKYLRSEDFEYLPDKFDASEDNEQFKLQHNLDVNNFLIAAMLLTKLEPIELVDFRHDSRLQHEPLYVGDQKVIADGFLNFKFQIDGKDKFIPTWLEIDEGSQTNKKSFRDKIRNIVYAVLSPEYEKHFPSKGGLPYESKGYRGTIAFPTLRGMNRVAFMRERTMEVLEEIHHLDMTTNFLFTSVTTFDPLTLFHSPIWYDAENNTAIPLLDMQ